MRQLKIQKSITNRTSEALDKYLVEIGRAPLISIDEEIELAQTIRHGGRAADKAKEKLVSANLRFVVSVAKQVDSSEHPAGYCRAEPYCATALEPDRCAEQD